MFKILRKWPCLFLLFLAGFAPPLQAQLLTASNKRGNHQNPEQQAKSQFLLTSVLANLEKKFNISFNFDNELLRPLVTDVSLLTNAPESLDAALAHLLKPHKLNFEKIAPDYYIIMPSPQLTLEGLGTGIKQDVKAIVSGKVTSKAGEGLPGVTVILKETNVGTTTGIDGGYSLTVPAKGGTLIFSFIGFITKEVAVGQAGTYNVTLDEDQKSLEEVVVIGYGEQKKITMTGAVSSVAGQELRQSPSASLQNTLAGRIPGFSSQQRSGQPGRDAAIFNIRGQSSFTGNNNPLIIVDDIEISYDQFARLDPNEIESVSILKDASTTAIYGIRGANGVVVVSTTRGKIGPPKVSLRSEYSMSKPVSWPDYLSAYESASLRTIAEINSNVARTFTDEDLELYRTGADPYGHPDVDWRDVLFKDFSSQYRTNVDITGGTEKARYFVSVGYLNQGGLVRDFSKAENLNSNYYHKRYNYRSNLDMQVTPNLDLRLDLYGNIGETNSPNVSDLFTEYSERTKPYSYPVHNPDGSYGYSLFQLNGNSNNNNIVGRLTHGGYNRNHENNMNFAITANQKLTFILPGLSAKGTIYYGSLYGYNRNMTRNLNFPSFIYNPTDDSYRPRDPNVYRIQGASLGYDAGSTTRKLTVLGILNYDQTFGSHHVYGMALYNRASNTLRNTTNTDYNYVPENTLGFTGRLGYDFKQKYLFQFNMAYNGSDRFDANNRFGIFPAASVGWNISEEPFFADNISFFNQFKLRSSYGLVGSDGTNGVYAYQQVYTSGGSISLGTNHTAYSGVQEGTLANDNVTWEKERKFDLGLDFGILNNTLSGAIDYFYNNRFDILSARGTISGIFGQSLPLVNLGETKNQGFETELNYRNKIGKNISYSIRGTYSVAKNKVLYRDEPPADDAYRMATGKPIGADLLYKWIGFYSEEEAQANLPVANPAPRPGDLKYADLNNDGVINTNDQFYTNYSNMPTTTYGVNFGFGYKKLNITAFFQGSGGNSFRGRGNIINFSQSNAQPIHKNHWTPEQGNNAVFPRIYTISQLTHPDNFPSTFWSRPADYLRLRTAEISYGLPTHWVRKLKLQDIKIYTNGFNLFTWTKLDDLYPVDPELANSTNANYYPPQKSFNFGFNVTF